MQRRLARPIWLTYGRATLIAVSTLYTATYHWVYIALVFPQHESFGTGYRELSWTTLVLIYAACITPSLWAPVVLRRPSALLLYVQYYLVFVPAAFLVFYSQRPQLPLNEARSLLLWMSLGMAVLQIPYLVPVARVRLPRFGPRMFWWIFAAAGLGLFAYEVVLLRGNFRLVDFTEIYSVRAELGDAVSAMGSRLVMYAASWINMYFVPLAFAAAITAQKRLLAASLLLAYVFSYGVSGQKSAALAIMFLPGFYFLLRYFHTNIGAAIAGGLSTLLLIAFPLRGITATVGVLYTAIVPFRLFTVEGLIFAQYYEFFRQNPHTHFAHLSGLGWFASNPYPLSIPATLGYYYYGVPVGSNVGMWASDALAGAGPWAIPLISVACGMVFWILDSCARALEPRFAALTLIMTAAAFSSVSLGTTLITGGLALVAVTFLVMPTIGETASHYVRPAWREGAEPALSPLAPRSVP
jgi:hypothetical protein